MNSDLFAAIRKHDSGISTSYQVDDAPAEHVEAPSVFHKKPQKTAVEHLEHGEHPVLKAGEQKTATPRPFRHVTVPEIRDGDTLDLPAEWRIGLNQLNAMTRPTSMASARWSEIIIDAHKFAWGWAFDPVIRDWSLGSMIGFDPGEPETHSLVLDIRGGGVVHMFKDDRGRDCAIIARGDRRHLHRRQMHDDAEPLWASGPIQTPRKRGFA